MAHPGFRIEVKPPKDTEIPLEKRDRFARLIQALIVGFLIIYVPYLIVLNLGGLITSASWSEWLFPLLGFGLGGLALAETASFLYVYNPEWTAYLTQDAIFGSMIPYGPGFHFTYFWEQRNKKGNYPLKLIPFNSLIPVQSGTSKVMAIVHGQYQASLPYMDQAVGSDPETVEEVIDGFVGTFLTGNFGGMTLGEILKGVDEANSQLADSFMAHLEGQDSSFTENTGYRMVSVAVKNFVLPEAVQKTRDAVDEAEQLHHVVENLFGLKPAGELARRMKLPANDPEAITHEQYQTVLNRAMATSDNAEMKLNVFEANIPEVVAKLFERFAPRK